MLGSGYNGLGTRSLVWDLSRFRRARNSDGLGSHTCAVWRKESGESYFFMQRSLILGIQIGYSHRAACVVRSVSPASCEQQAAIRY